MLLLHGQPGGARDWARVVGALAGRGTAIAIVRPGWDGHSAPLNLDGNAAAAVAVLDARGIDRATVAGHSLGGAVAAWLAAHYPERVAALVPAAAPRLLSTQIRGARLMVLERAGHLLPQLHPRRVADAIALALESPSTL